MTAPMPQPLALTLAASAAAWLGLEAHEESLRSIFVPAVAALDEADAAYRAAIETTLAPETARDMLAAMEAFRARVREVRYQTRTQIAELYRRYGASYGWFDPVNPFVPATTGLSHADGTRVATIADGARLDVESARAQVNDAIVKRLQSTEIETLRAAKLRRVAAFDAALGTALAAIAQTFPHLTSAELEKARHRLAELAEGWY